MSTNKGNKLLVRAGLVMWGLFTLALLFSVILLSLQLVELGSNPLSFAVSETAPVQGPAAEPVDSADAKTVNVTLHFGDPARAALQPETRSVALAGSTVQNCRAALQELVKGSANGLAPIVPSATQVRSVYLMDDGELIVDLSADAIDPARNSTASESLLLYGIVNTVSQGALTGESGPPVRKVRVLIDGEAYQGHIDLSAAYLPDPSWVAAAESPKG